MDPLSSESLSDLHIEACAAAIKGFCRHERITQEYFAGLIGITPVHLSYVLRQRRRPGLKFERGIEQSARLPTELKEAVLNALWAAQQYGERERAGILYRAAQQPLAELVAAIERLYTVAGRGQMEPDQARRIHQQLYRNCAALTSHLGRAMEDPRAYVRLCVMQAEIGCVLDRLYDSLAAALLAERIAANFTGPDHRSQVRELRAPQTNAIRAKAIVLYNLHLHSQAYVQCLRAEETASVKDSPEIWLPHIVRDKLKALAHRSRFSIREAEECARLGWDACASQAWDANVAEMLSFLIDLSLVGCYLSYGGHSCLARASSMMEQHLDRVRANRAGAITPLHKVMFYKTLAELECAAGPRGARDAGVDFGRALSTALTIASRAGLANQLRKIRLRYGTTALRLAEQEGIELS